MLARENAVRTEPAQEISDEAIRARSQEIWEREGRPEGCDLEHWVRARSELESEQDLHAATEWASDPEATVAAAAAMLKTTLEMMRSVPRPKPHLVAEEPSPKAETALPAIPEKKLDAAALVPSIISAGFHFTGRIETAGEVHLDGSVGGTIAAAILLIGKAGVLKGDAVAAEVIVHGRIEGSIRARKLVLCPGSQVEGEIFYDEIIVEEGARMNCYFRPLAAETATEDKPLTLSTAVA